MDVNEEELNYLVDDEQRTYSTKIYRQPIEDSINTKADTINQKMYVEVTINDRIYQSKEHENLEYALIQLQKELPPNIRIESCLTCRNGNFNPYGNIENQVYCLREVDVSNFYDVVRYFTLNKTIEMKIRSLFDVCQNYNPMSTERYSYNDWKNEMNDQQPND